MPLPGLRHPAFASRFEKHLRLAGRCPNNDSLLPPLAAVVVVAPKGRGLKLTDMFQALPLGELDAKRPERARTLTKSISLKEKEL